MKNHWIRRGIFMALTVVGGAIVFGYIVMSLWNWLMPALFAGAVIITFWQALGILVLSKILFGGWKGRCGRGNHGHWRNGFRAKWEGMSEEEREKFRKCCN